MTPDAPPTGRRWLTADEAAAHLRITRRALYMRIRRGQVLVMRMGRSLRFDVRSLDATVRASMR